MPDPLIRWRPHRAGIRNIWEYDDQIFDFSDGRLVLRGPNGSGKSNALALLVPFLLDGVMAANRMDSLSGGRSMKTLLLCLADDERGNRFRHEQRTGYAWIELERGDDHLTIGCGARASTQRDAEAWFFVTPRRPGVDLELAPGGVPLSRGGLVEAIGAAAVHDSAEAYRSAVDRSLFGLGSHRYRNLIELLLVLRRPHLASKLNLEHLSKVLSDGLAALDEQLIADIAASFEDLEAVQRDLRRLQEAHRTVQSFLPAYRRYLRATGRARAQAMSDAERALRSARRRVADAEKSVASSELEIERVRQARLESEEHREVAAQRQRAVLESPAYRDAMSLVEVDGRAVDAERDSVQAEERLAKARDEVESAASEVARARAGVREAKTRVDGAFSAAGVAADQAGIGWVIAPEDIDGDDLPRTVRALATERRHDIAEVRGARREADDAAIQATAAEDTATRSVQAAAEAEEARNVAAAAVDAARADLMDAVRGWIDGSGIAELEVVGTAAELVGEPEQPSLTDVLAAALQFRRDELAARGARAIDLERALSEEREAVREDRQRVLADPVLAPERAATRTADRAGRAGAPLYACCDFADSVSAADRAGLEAAIEGAGLLDTWIGEASDELDAWLRPGPPAPGESLADVLVVALPEDSRLASNQVERVLASIALADAGIAVLPDGRFHLGPLVGRFEKPEAEFIGASARERRRQRLLDELDARIAELTRQLVLVAAEREAIAAERARLDEITDALPSAAQLLACREQLLRAAAAATATTDAATRDEALARDARIVAERRLERLRAIASERRLPADDEGLAEAEQLVHAYDQRANALVNSAAILSERHGAEARANDQLRRNEATVESCRNDHDELLRRAAGLRARVEQLRSQLGADADAPLRELKAIEGELRDLRNDAERLNREAATASEQRGRALQEESTAREALGARETAVTEASARLDVLRRDDLWAVVVGSESEVPSAFAEMAAAVLTATADVTAEADQNALERAYRVLLDELGRGYDPGLSYIDQIAVVEVTSDLGTFSVLWLAGELGGQVELQQELLSERDREIFERHLLTRASEALRELLNDADELVRHINRSLADRPTASGKTVQLRWEFDTADPVVRTALSLLRKTPELLGPDEREQLRRFFSTAIAQRRAEDAAASYADILRHVLDYRAWHAFVPHVRSAGGGTQRLTRTLFRSLSGGEQAVVLHLPLFAAAAAHYDAAAPDAPRLVALDEAFAGIDEGMRGELMGLLVRFDLDVVLTGHELWGAYEQVPSLMVYDLLRQPPLEGVSAFAVRWDGVAMAEA